MNCLAHAFRHLDRPDFAVGTCVPDWLGMIDRQARVKRQNVEDFLTNELIDQGAREVASGILQHFEDDDRFHNEAAFLELNAQYTCRFAQRLQGDRTMRPRFLAHILIELILDAEIELRFPGCLERYYDSVAQVDCQKLQDTVNRFANKPTCQLMPFLPRYLEERYLFDYLEDEGLLRRVNGVMRRVKMPLLPPDFRSEFPSLRQSVRERFDQLCSGSEVD